MNGTKYFFDTNAIIAYLKGNVFINDTIARATWIGTSAICVVEFLSYAALLREDVFVFYIFLDKIELIGVSTNLSYLEALSTFKKESKLKLPDALIAHAAIANNATLITNDKHFQTITRLSVLSF